MKLKTESKTCYKIEKFIISVLSIFLLTVILHFLYEKTGIKVFAIISAVNESVWEHMKIGFYGGLIYAIFEWMHVGRYIPNFCIAKGISIPLIPFLMMVMFYTYTGIIGTNILAVDILITFLSILIAQIISCKIINNPKLGDEGGGIYLCALSILVLIILVITFTMFTYNPPEIPLFLDPLTNTYGI